jgi:transposase-like protein
MSGEREFSIEEIARKHGLTYHTVYRAVKGKPGYRVYGKKRGAKVSESLYRSFLAEAIRRGLAA